MFRVVVRIAEDGAPRFCDAIEHKGRIWLVPHWLESPTRAGNRPSRLIPLDILQHHEVATENANGVDYVLDDPMTKQLFGETVPPQLAKLFQVVEGPDIVIPAGYGRIQ